MLMRKSAFPIKFSPIPLLLLLTLSILRVFVVINIPNAMRIFSESIFPTIINLIRFEIVSLFGFSINAVSIFICTWIFVAVCLNVRYLYDYIGNFRPIMNWTERCERDEYAESMLADIIGSDKQFYVFRNGSVSTAMATAVKPYIILPKIEFPPDELRIILLHEWKHIQDKDYLTGFIIDIICCVFWWNPMVYILRKNFRFAIELKCDQFSVSSKKDFKHYVKGHLLLEIAEDERINSRLTNAFVSNDEEYNDRFKVLLLLVKQGASRNKRILNNVFYSSVIVALFFMSYMFVILPISWESPDVLVSAESFTEEYSEGGGIFRSDESFVVDNGDGTFSLYIDGQFVKYMTGIGENFRFLPVRERE